MNLEEAPVLKSELSSDASLELVVAMEAAARARHVLLSYFGRLTQVEEKFQAGLVSEADRESERVIREYILEKFPAHRFWGEESGLSSGRTADQTSKAIWMIDPLDGTTNYVHRFPLFCSSLGLEVDGHLKVGVVDAPMLNMTFHAEAGKGAFLNGEPIEVSSRKLFSEGLFATGFSTQDDTLDEQFRLIAETIRFARGIRRGGAAALDLCFVAHGVFDVFWEKRLAPWDTAAGALIVKEAGGVVSDLTGQKFDPRLKSIVAGSPALHTQFLNRVREWKIRS